MVLLGIDPGTKRAGYGLIEVSGRKAKYLTAGVLAVEGKEGGEILLKLKEGVSRLIKEWQPEGVAIEKLFFAKNRKTGMQVAEARGIILTTCLEKGLKVWEFAPNEIKLNLTGYGGADKKAVQKMVEMILGKPPHKLIDDAYDALASALVAAEKIRFSTLTN